MPRALRLNLANIPQHVVQRGNNKQACFISDQDRCFYLNKLHQYIQKFNIDLHAYILMSNHVHLLVTPKDKTGVSLLMQFLGRSYVRYFNKKYKRTGTLWEGRFKSSLIDSEHYFLTVSRYIELNPVRANMVAMPQDYLWSSFHANALGKTDELISHHDCYIRMGKTHDERRNCYRALFEQAISEKILKELRSCINKSQILGRKKFQQNIEQVIGKKVIKAEHGGDRRSDAYMNKNQ